MGAGRLRLWTWADLLGLRREHGLGAVQVRRSLFGAGACASGLRVGCGVRLAGSACQAQDVGRMSDDPVRRILAGGGRQPSGSK